MQSQVLEQILEPVQIQKEVYATIDLYTSGQSQMYTGTMKPIGYGIGMPLGGPEGMQQPKPIQTTLHNYGIGIPIIPPSIERSGSILRKQYNLEHDWKLQERFDFSDHKGKNNEYLGPHINYDIINPSGSVIKKYSDILGDSHQIKLPLDIKEILKGMD